MIVYRIKNYDKIIRCFKPGNAKTRFLAT